MTSDAKMNHFRYKGHESFIIRDGWITKGLVELAKEDGTSLFSDFYGADRLGVGPNMAKAIRYWLETANLMETKSKKTVLSTIGECIYTSDAYLEDMFTLWIIHLNIVNNSAKATAWYQFFSEFEMDEFTKDEMRSLMLRLAEMDFGAEKKPASTSVIADCDAILQMYADKRLLDADPEEKKKSLFFSLGLLRFENEKF